MQHILNIFVEQGFYCSARRIHAVNLDLNIRDINLAITEARKLGLPNVDTLNSNSLSQKVRHYQTAMKLELENKTNKLLHLQFTAQA